MKVRHAFPGMALLMVLSVGAGQAAVLHTSARVQIVPSVDIRRVGAALPLQSPDQAQLTALAAEAIGFLVDGPAERTVQVVWTGLTFDGDGARSPSVDCRHDDAGELLLEYDLTIGAELGNPAEGYLLVLEYE